MTVLDNVQTWDDVALLPWAESFTMACPPQASVTVPSRRRVDVRTLADVVLAMEAAA